MKVLYHYTAAEFVDSILNDGYLRLTESNLTNWSKKGGFPYKEYNAGTLKLYKPVVWMTEDEVINADKTGLFSDYVDKTVVKITIKKRPYFKKYVKWARANNIDLDWYKAMTTGFNKNSWWISENIVKLDKDVIKIENQLTGEVYFENDNVK